MFNHLTFINSILHILASIENAKHSFSALIRLKSENLFDVYDNL